MIRSCLAALSLCMFNGCSPNKIAQRRIIDLTHDFSPKTIYWPTEKGFIHEKEHFGQTDKGYFYSAYRINCAEHGGTHMDAPIHFNKDGQTADEIPLTALIGDAVVVDVSNLCKQNKDYLITIEDLVCWEKQYKKKLNGKIVLLKTGFANFWPDRLLYMGTNKQGKEALEELHFPGLDPKAALWLAQEKKIKAVGIDTPSIDFGQSKFFEAHRHLFANNVPAFENVASLDGLPSHGFDILALPMKIKDGSGAPLRIIALLR